MKWAKNMADHNLNVGDKVVYSSSSEYTIKAFYTDGKKGYIGLYEPWVEFEELNKNSTQHVWDWLKNVMRQTIIPCNVNLEDWL